MLDSGPGFAATRTGTPLDQLTLDAEEAAVRARFGRGSAKGQSRFGEGLPRVMRLLRRQKGFLRLRSGKLSSYIDFSDEDQGGEAVLQRYQQSDLAGLSPIAGSLLTVLIPMRRP